MDQRWDTRQPCYLRALARECGLEISSVHTPFGVIAGPGWDGDQISRIRRTVELAGDVGARVVVVHLPMRWQELTIRLSGCRSDLWLPTLLPRDAELRKWLLTGLRELEAASGVCIGVENMPLSTRWRHLRVNRFQLNDPRRPLEHISRYPHLTLDTTHLATWGVDALGFYKLARDKVVNIHLSNYRDGLEHALPWAGEIPLSRFVEHLHEDGYEGNLVIELHPGALGAKDEEAVRRNLARCAHFCRQPSSHSDEAIASRRGDQGLLRSG